MKFLKLNSIYGPVEYVNIEKISGFRFDQEENRTVIYTNDGWTWTTEGNKTGDILKILRRAADIAVFSLEEA